jgi:hypothetical protein
MSEEMPWKNQPSVAPETETYTSEGLDATTMHLNEFFNAVKNGTPTKQDASVGHHAAACAHMVNLSIDARKTVFWDHQKDTVKQI